MAKQVDSCTRQGVHGGVLMVGEQIRTERESQGRSLSSLARDAGVGKSYLWRIENCQASPSLATIRRIADALGVKVIGGQRR